MSTTPEILWPALRQYRHNTGGNEFIAGFDYGETVSIVSKLEQQLAHERKTGFIDGQMNAEIKMAGIVSELREQLAELREAAATYKNNGHSPSCRRHTLYTNGGRCICGYDELAALLKQGGE